MKKDQSEKKRSSGWFSMLLSGLALLFLFLFLPSGAQHRESLSATDKEEIEIIEIEPSFEEESPTETAIPSSTASPLTTPNIPSPTPTPTPTPSPTPFVDIIDENRDITENLSVEISSGNKDSFVYHVARVKIANADQFRTAFAQGEYGKSYRAYTSKMAAANGAVVAINGDYYGFRNSGLVVRNGELYRNKPAARNDLLLVDKDGDLHILDEASQDGEKLLQEGARHCFSFGPGLVQEGKAMEMPSKYMISTRVREPRSAIGQVDALHYLLVTVDGRSSDSKGATLSELAALMAELGCHTAYNLDGGGSSTMVFRDEVVNNVSGKGQRSISDIIYFSKE